MEHHPVIASALKLINYLAIIGSKEMTVSVADTERYILNVPTQKLNLNIKPGDPIKKGSIADIVLREGTRQVQRIPKEVFGVPFVGVGVPLRDEQNIIVGLILTGTPIDDQEEVREMADNLAAASEQISAATDNLAVNSQQLATTAEEVASQASSMESEVQRVDDIVRIVKGITNRTNILGLNAAIEAARAGESGRGFSVVAEEIRKMAADTNSSTQQISETVTGIKDLLSDISQKISNLAGLYQGQAATTEEIASSTQQIGVMSQTLKGLADHLA
ncbi:methyl-accepting chemotaxis protein [Desulfitobacterium sp. Sab5]|uniref:methyl-accepting chemotaxis protein n=1 Tax=Desulfitobacterium nosdiversum TaxID=3375356 RepID=UPI003CF4F784